MAQKTRLAVWRHNSATTYRQLVFKTTYKYDVMGRVLKTAVPLGLLSATTYTAAGR